MKGLTTLSNQVRGEATQCDARRNEIFNMKVISTDPPYYDNIAYADLSDFFYIWLRRSLRTVFPESLGYALPTPKAEELDRNSLPPRNSREKCGEVFS